MISKQWFIDAHVGNIKDVYHFEERLGSGGFGVVYLAIHKTTGKNYKYLSIKITVYRGQVCCQSYIEVQSQRL
jgi:serine/threonine protein kinase